MKLMASARTWPAHQNKSHVKGRDRERILVSKMGRKGFYTMPILPANGPAWT